MQKTGFVSVLALGLEQDATAAAGDADRPTVLATEIQSQTSNFVSCP